MSGTTGIKTFIKGFYGGNAASPCLARVDNSGALKVFIGMGLPSYGKDATGEDTYAEVLTSPARIINNLYARVSTNDAILSLDGGSNDHIYLEAGSEVCLNGIYLAASQSIQGKNAAGGSNYVNLIVIVW